MDPAKLRATHKHPLTLVAGVSQCRACTLYTNPDQYYYRCDTCENYTFHKECITYYIEITHPYHPIHPLQICTREYEFMEDCFWCNKFVGYAFYRCAICDLNIHLFCASQAQLVLTLDPGNEHDHPLTIFPRKIYFTCNLCGCSGEWFPIYACVQCDFMVHRDCLDRLPRVIRISCHEHRIFRRLYLPPGKWFCGVCRSEVDPKYGAFFCTKGCGYVAHTSCAILSDVWDGSELQHVSEDLDELKDVEPYEVIDDNRIKHFSHDHYLRFFLNLDGDKKRRCQACTLLIQFDNFYTCDYCDNFILHQECANFQRMRWHPLHRHPLTLKANDDIGFHFNLQHSWGRGFYFCFLCDRFSCAFSYVCEDEIYNLAIDVRCASMPEELNHKSHTHPLFRRLINRSSRVTCVNCSKETNYVYYCQQCPNYVMCYECVTLPDKVAYKHDEHPLILCCGENEEEEGGQYWCETCEKKLDNKQWFYKCDDCCVTIHIGCLLGATPYAKPGRIMIKPGHNREEIERIFSAPHPEVAAERILVRDEEEFDIIANETLSRPICCNCDRRCQDSVAFKQEQDLYCSLDCLRKRKVYDDPVIFPESLSDLCISPKN